MRTPGRPLECKEPRRPCEVAKTTHDEREADRLPALGDAMDTILRNARIVDGPDAPAVDIGI